MMNYRLIKGSILYFKRVSENIRNQYAINDNTRSTNFSKKKEKEKKKRKTRLKENSMENWCHLNRSAEKSSLLFAGETTV